MAYLKSHKLMSLATYNRLPWSAILYFVFDTDLNFYFLGSPSAIHNKNILKNPKVSVTVADSHQKVSDKKVGFQARGVAKEVGIEKDIKKVLLNWNKRHTDAPPLTFDILSKKWKSKLYKIKLTDIKMYNENLSDDQEERVWKL